MMPVPLSEGQPRLRGNLLLQRIIALVLEQHHQEAAEHGEQIKYQQRDKSPSERHEQKAGRSQDERHRQVGRLPELGNRQESVPVALRDGPGPDERVHHRLVMLEDELEKEVGNDEANEDKRDQQRRHFRDALFPQHREQQQFNHPEIGNDDDSPNQSLVLLAEKLTRPEACQYAYRSLFHSLLERWDFKPRCIHLAFCSFGN